MKITGTHQHLLYLLIGISLLSCQNDKSLELVRKAQNSLIMEQPAVARYLLSSVSNPENLDEYNHMLYVVTYVGAKYETKEDIKNDTLILEAQKYFNKKGDTGESTLANYYAAQVYDVNSNFPKALEAYMHAAYNAKESGNHLIAGKSLNNIGYIYYEQDIFDSAIVNFRRALLHYDKTENADQRKLKTFTNLGRSYDCIKKLDSAYLYFSKALDNAVNTKNEKYQSFSLQNLGVTCYSMEKYDKAIGYFQSALAMDATDNRQTRQIQLYILKIYNKKQDLKSAERYADLVIANLAEATYIYTIKEMYAALSEYYQQAGDYQQALQYSDLEKATKNQIEQETNTPALLDADKNFYLAQKNKKINQLQTYKHYIRYFEELF